LGNIIRINNLPMDTSKEDIMVILKNFKVQENDIHMLPSSDGVFSGCALVTFPNEMEAQKERRFWRNLRFNCFQHLWEERMRREKKRGEFVK
jgi:hypothetical protein